MTRLDLSIDVPGNIDLDEMISLLADNVRAGHGITITLPRYDIFDVVLTNVKEVPDGDLVE